MCGQAKAAQQLLTGAGTQTWGVQWDLINDNFTELYGWGDHSLEGYLTAETDSIWSTAVGSAYDTSAELDALFNARAKYTTQSVTCTDSGDGNPGTVTITPTTLYTLNKVAITVADADGCTATIAEGSATNGDRAEIINQSAYALDIAYSAAAFEYTGGVSGNTLSMSQGGSVTIIYDSDRWRVTSNQSDSVYIKGIAVPAYAHFANADAAYNDTATPHVLLAAEVKGSVITNYGATEARVYTMPANPCGANFIMMVGAAYQMDLEPDGTEQIWLNSTQAAAGEHIINAGATEGESMSCFAVEASDGVCELHCESKYANFAEATP